jgi:hypothetical protein
MTVFTTVSRGAVSGVVPGGHKGTLKNGIGLPAAFKNGNTTQYFTYAPRSAWPRDVGVVVVIRDMLEAAAVSIAEETDMFEFTSETPPRRDRDEFEESENVLTGFELDFTGPTAASNEGTCTEGAETCGVFGAWGEGTGDMGLGLGIWRSSLRTSGTSATSRSASRSCANALCIEEKKSISAIKIAHPIRNARPCLSFDRNRSYCCMLFETIVRALLRSFPLRRWHVDNSISHCVEG